MRRTTRERLVALCLLGLTASGLAAVTTTAAAAADPCSPGGNEIACENSLPGSPPSEWEVDGAGDEGLQGFATDISVDRGGRIDFKIDTDASDYDITIYRTGWYDGLGARRIAEIQPSASLPQAQPPCLTDVTTDLVDCGNWGVSASWTVPDDAVSGVYLAHLEDPVTRDESHITFIVRNDASESDVVFQTSDTTWQAYNTYGGASLYQGTHLGRATKVSYNRPFQTRDGPGGRDFYFANEYPMVRFLERNGYDVSYIAGVDTDRSGELLTNHDVFLSVGHDEYWSGRQRQNVEAARDEGVNLQFLSGNEVYWRTRWEDAIDGSDTAHRTLVTYKETWEGAKTDPSSEWTGTWRDPRFAAPADGGGLVENALTGTAYMVNFSDLALTVPASQGRMRLWRNTSVASQPAGGQVTLAPHTVGYESDEDLVNHLRPDGLIRLSETTGAVPEYLQDFGTQVEPGTTTHHLTMHRAASGALVFGAGTVQWTWGLDGTHDSSYAPEPADPRMQQAQVNLLADMGAQPASLMSGLAPASASTDTTGPTVQVTTPVPEEPVPNGTEVTLAGTASDTGGGQVAGVEVSTDGGETWRPASGRATWSHTYLQQGQGPTDVLVRAMDDSANIGATLTHTLPVACPCSVFGTEQPEVPAADDAGAVELGLRFTPEVDGYVSGVRFFKGQGNSGVHTGSLWSAGGQRLADVVFTDESASGWQEAEFDVAVPVVEGETYVVSYTSPNGHYAVADQAFAAVGRDAFPLSVRGGFGAEPAGVFADPGRFPDRSFRNAHYYVDPMFITTDEAPLVATDQTPRPDAASIPASTPLHATFSKPVVGASAEMSVVGPDGTPVPGAVAYDAAERTVTFTPDQPLTSFTVYDVEVDGEDAQGRTVSAGGSWRFRTARPTSPPGVCPCTVFDDSTLPTLVEDPDTVPVTLGMRFSPTKPGVVTGIRFYRGPRNAGPHVGTLWSADGQVLAEGTFSGEWTTGWQELTFDDPVRLTPGEEYVASYRTPGGRYSATPNAFSAQDLSRGPLQVFRDSGAYTYGQGSPTSRSTHSYLVDVVYETDAPSVELAETAPEDGAEGVLRDTQVSAWLSDPVSDGAELVATVGGTPVAGTTAVSSDGRRVTFTPDQPWPRDSLVQVGLSGVLTQEGAELPPQEWSFRTTDDPVTGQTLLGTGTPATEAVNDSGEVEVGMAWSPEVDGTVTQIRFFKGVGNTGEHVGSLWSAAGTRLASVTFDEETPSGWQTATLQEPLAVTAGTTYVVSYLAPEGHYSATSQYFADPRAVGDLTAPSGSNGRYRYAAGGGFPDDSWGSTSYWVDVRFVPEAPSLEIASRTPAPGAEGVTVGVSPRVSFSDALAPGWSMTATVDGDQVAGTASRSADGRTLVFEPDDPLPGGALVEVRIADVSSVRGASVADTAWQFTTGPAELQEWSLFADVVPDNAAVNDPAAVELGTVFTTDVDGEISAIRFHKGPGNSGTHTGSIWSMTGDRLAQVTFSGESAGGWQEAALDEPVPVQAGTSYVVSYYAPNGSYSTTPRYFDLPRSVGPLSTPTSGNGRYVYGTGGGFPTGTFRATNYFVDVVLRGPAE